MESLRRRGWGAPVDASPANAYRPDIDGLRALAVLPVILFHAHLFFPGGFVGVDVFFVISGYLITQIIERDLQAHKFSVLVFYQRRIRRIFPALFVMCACSILLAYVLLIPEELRDFGKTLLASSAFSSNILFYRWSGYFAPDSEFAPLLHTWTLSVEEQFYVCWPLLLRVLSLPWAARWKTLAALSILGGSLTLSAYWVGHDSNAAFYLLPSRAWELALGALLCLSPLAGFFARLPRPVASIASLAGIGLLGLALVTYSAATPFPGWAALLPCVATALIIAAGEGGPSLGGRILSFRPLVWIGLMSYSLYLWHWPILVFGHLLANHPLRAAERVGLVGLTFLVSWLSWRVVERPFRHAQVVRATSRTWVLGGLATSAAFIVIGAVLFWRDGLPARGPDVAAIVQELAAELEALDKSKCLARSASLPAIDGCLLGAQASTPGYEIVLWGDSHAAQFAPVFHSIGQRLGVTTRQITKAGCAPLSGVAFGRVDWMRVGCPAFNDDALKEILGDSRVRVVVMAARWDPYVDGSMLLTLGGANPSLNQSHQLFVASLRHVLMALTDGGRQVMLIGQVPLPPAEFLRCITRARFKGWPANGCAIDESVERADTEASVNRLLAQAGAGLEAHVEIVHPYDDLCRHNGCLVETAERFVYMDKSHLSFSGAHLLETRLENSLTSALRWPQGSR